MARTLDLFARHDSRTGGRTDLEWPEAARFPLNLDSTRRVEDTVLDDLGVAREPLIVTGFASLDRLIAFIAARGPEQSARILLGSEPFPPSSTDWALGDARFDEEIVAYWLERGISLHLSARLVVAIEGLRAGSIMTRYVGGSQRLHAKIYVSERAATVGSSNYTRPGFATQLEANARFDARQDRKRYAEIRRIAENYWELGRPYNDELIALLEQLLRVVSWQEALARACAELLEGEWARDYLRPAYLPEEASLWPAQRQGIAQALYILSRHDSVLIADATGSGKTRLGVHLVRAVQDHIIRSNRLRQGKSLMVCPPAVLGSWQLEGLRAGAHLDAYSHGALSHTRSKGHELTVESLKRAQILCVDEGHNFLNVGSNRTRHLLRNMADHVLLFTATPINRSVSDLLRIADLLGADNLDPSTQKAFRKLLGVSKLRRSLTEEEIDLLRREIQRFTVRRTKTLFNALIDRDPVRYTDRSGKPCRYPRHHARTYRLDESAGDCRLAMEIRALADELRAVSFFEHPVEMPTILRERGVAEESYLAGRLSAAKKLARHLVMSSLRSSNAALYEHLAGTAAAKREFDLGHFKRSTGLKGVFERLERIAGAPPENRLSVAVPPWLTDTEAHRAACEHDAGLYRHILTLLSRMSDLRETRKAAHLNALLNEHPLVLAFDSRPITLAYLQSRLSKGSRRAQVLVATGDAQSSRPELLQTFALGSAAQNVVGLCSDSLAEGVNLQQASAMVHLDMPSVVRVAEQRVGRVDRMDSPHESIEVWWPDDAEAFQLSSDERFLERYATVEDLLGSNLPLPEHLDVGHGERLPAQRLIDEYERVHGDLSWDGIQDAFAPVRAIVEGDNALVATSTYEQYRGITAKVLSRVSLVRARTPWAFFAISAGGLGAPRWLLLPGFNQAVVTDLDDICLGLRERLGEGAGDLAMDDEAERTLTLFLQRLSGAERLLLSRKKQRALEELTIVLEQYQKQAARSGSGRASDYHELLLMLNDPPPEAQPDWDEVAARWLDLIRPTWYDRMLRRRKGGMLLLRDLRRDLIADEAELGAKLLQAFRRFPLMPAPDERISACIVGVP